MVNRYGRQQQAEHHWTRIAGTYRPGLRDDGRSGRRSRFSPVQGQDVLFLQSLLVFNISRLTPLHSSRIEKSVAPPKSHLDPVCGMKVDPANAAGVVEHNGRITTFAIPPALRSSKRIRTNIWRPGRPTWSIAQALSTPARWTPKSVRSDQAPVRNVEWRLSR